MAPLVGYGSSDEEDDEVQSPAAAASAPLDAPNQPAIRSSQPANVPETEAHVSPPPPPPLSKTEQSAPAPETGPVLPPGSVAMGPSLPPADQREAYPEQVDDEDLDQDRYQDQDIQAGQARPPSSPYSASRALLHQLTLPTVPDLDIPPSPPLGSPSSGAKRAALTVKFDKFLELKRTKGVHFNARIAESHAFRNPEQSDKLLSFVGIDTKFDRDSGAAGASQYCTTLPADVWDPAGFPAWAYRGRLRLSQEKLLKERTRAQGEAVQFVPAANP